MYIHPTADDNEMHIYCTSSRGDLRALHSTASGPRDLASAFPSRNIASRHSQCAVSSSLILDRCEADCSPLRFMSNQQPDLVCVGKWNVEDEIAAR
jgi:hypothetical protein